MRYFMLSLLLLSVFTAYSQDKAKIEKLLKFVKVEGGTFVMGDKDEMDAVPHEVELSTYYMQSNEVTQELWVSVMGNYHNVEAPQNNIPMYSVSWEDCQEFIKKLNAITGKKYRLPTEAEWEYAARGGKKSNGYKYSGSDNLDELSWHHNNSGDKPHPVAGKKPNELGIYDMSGNVIEWCNDWYEENLGTAKRKNPQGPKDGEFKIQRGGAYNTIFVSDLVFMRSHAFPTTDYSNMGFRLALSAE
jgi:formylglycine-generating enzyme required for sulfatase activity